MKLLTAVLVATFCTTGCRPVDGARGHGGTTLQFALTEYSFRNTAATLVEVLEQVATAETTRESEYGVHARVRVLEVLRSSSDDGYTYPWRSGDEVVVSMALLGADSLCMSEVTRRGSHVVVFHSLSHPLPRKTPFGEGVSTGLTHGNACVGNGTVVIHSAREGFGIVERVEMPLDLARAFLLLPLNGSYDEASADLLGESIRSECALRSCNPPTTCLLGAGCATVTPAIDVPGEFYTWRIRVDGTRPARSETGSLRDQ